LHSYVLRASKYSPYGFVPLKYPLKRLYNKNNQPEDTIGNHYEYSEKRANKINARTDVQHLHGVQRPGSAGKNDSSTLLFKPLGPGRHTQKGQGCCSGSSLQARKTGQKAVCSAGRTAPEGIQGARRGKRRSGRRRTRALLAKKKSGLGLSGKLKGHFKKEVRTAVVESIKEGIAQGLTQKCACEIFGLVPRKYRRWANPKPLVPRTAWNKILPEEREAVLQTVCQQQFWGKPMSHIFVHGHDSGAFSVSLSSVHSIIKSEKLVRQVERRKRSSPYVSAHELLKQGFSLLCYDASEFFTETGVKVWALPVLILPQRYLLHIGHCLNGVSAQDLTNTVREALALLPEHMFRNLLAHSDRGSAMKALSTKKIIKELIGAPVHYGRPHTPDDQAWIEALIKTLKYHREAPASFPTVDDMAQWFTRFPDIYNNDPHSSLKYVTPLQALSGLQEVILSQRKQNLLAARNLRHAAWKNSREKQTVPQASEVVMLPA
jgi:putative transposase